MAHIHRRKTWDVSRSDCTPENVFQARRAFIKAAGLVGLGAVGGISCRTSSAGPQDESLLKKSLAPVVGSSFRPGKRNPIYHTDRPTTDELVAAQYNNFYEFGLDKDRCWRQAQELTVRPWAIEIGGMVSKPRTIDIDDLMRLLPCEERLYQFRCVERWAMVVPWSGFAFKALMDLVEPLASAKFVRFVSFLNPEEAVGQAPGGGWKWPYYEGLTIKEAANELCLCATGLYGHDLPKQHGAPLRMVLPWKYGYKGAKSVVKIEFVDHKPKTFWNDANPKEYGFFSNVNPGKPHPRWSQKREWMIGSKVQHDTRLYNGYERFVAHLYNGKEH